MLANCRKKYLSSKANSKTCPNDITVKATYGGKTGSKNIEFSAGKYENESFKSDLSHK